MCKEILESPSTDDAALEHFDGRCCRCAGERCFSNLEALSSKRLFPAVYQVGNYLGSPWALASLFVASHLQQIDARRQLGMSWGLSCALLGPPAAFGLP